MMAADLAFLQSLEDTVPRFFVAQAKARGARIAMRAKRYGIWEATSWADYLDRAERVGNALLALGLKRGETSAIIAENRPEWLFADVGAMLAGEAGVPIPDGEEPLLARLALDPSPRLPWYSSTQPASLPLCHPRDELALAANRLRVALDHAGIRPRGCRAVLVEPEE